MEAGPAPVRSALTRFSGQRRFLYQYLSAIAHPNKNAMLALDPWQAGHKRVDPDALLPRYSEDEIAQTLRALFVSQFLAQLDFDSNHLSSLNTDQRPAFGAQAQKMAEYYGRVVESQLPESFAA